MASQVFDENVFDPTVFNAMISIADYEMVESRDHSITESAVIDVLLLTSTVTTVSVEIPT